MGQYYHPTNLDKKQFLSSHDYGNGLKLMEHSYIGNGFLKVIEKLLTPMGEWFKNRIVWAGDYADPEPESLNGKPESKENRGENIYHIIGEVDSNKITPTEELGKGFPYLINHTLNVFIDLRKVKEFEKGWKIHPLPLLTCEGNGRGGGDFHGNDDRIGMWARHSISLEKTKSKGYHEVDGTFLEENS